MEKEAQPFYTARTIGSGLGPLGQDVMPITQSGPEPAAAPGPSIGPEDIEHSLGINTEPMCSCPLCGYEENCEDEKVCVRYNCPVCGMQMMGASS